LELLLGTSPLVVVHVLAFGYPFSHDVYVHVLPDDLNDLSRSRAFGAIQIKRFRLTR
jgi:hypothetical protein